MLQISREGKSTAHIDIHNAALELPGPRSDLGAALATPSRIHPSPTGVQSWSTPAAFLKRPRLSDGPIFGAGYDPLADAAEIDAGRKNKRRRKSYKDWGVWTYSARTPSPEKEDGDQVDDYDALLASPTRPIRVPQVPKLSPEPTPTSEVALPLEKPRDSDITYGSPDDEPRTIKDSSGEALETCGVLATQEALHDDFERDSDYYDLYAGPNELPPTDARFANGGDTVCNTDESISDEVDEVDNSVGITDDEPLEPAEKAQPFA
jgi:hypothetical protein